MSTQIQRNFSGGELAPGLYARADQVKYATGVRKLRNFFPRASGGAVNRAGFAHVGLVKDSTTVPAMIPFVFSDDQSYILEFGDNYIRLWADGERVVAPAPTAWSNATAYVVGNIAASGGNFYYCILAHTNHVPPNATYWYLLTAQGADAIIEIPTTYDILDVRYIQFAQSNDVVTLTHDGYVMQQLSRYSATRWGLAAVSFGVGIAAPTNVAVTAGTPIVATGISITSAVGGDVLLQPPDQYIVISLKPGAVSGEFDTYVSEVELADTGQATGIDPVTVTWASVSGATSYVLYKLVLNEYRMIAITAPGVLTFVDDATVTPTTVIGIGSDPILLFEYAVTAISDATGVESLISASDSDTGLFARPGRPNHITWTTVSGATEYNVYAKKNGVFAFVGSSSGAGSFLDEGVTPDTTVRPPVAPIDLSSANNRPATVEYFQQRMALGYTVNKPSQVAVSRVGNSLDFSHSTPLADDDGFAFTLVSKRRNFVRYLLALDTLFIFTSDGEWTANGDVNGALIPSSPNLRQRGYRGAARGLPPIPIENTALFVQARGTAVRDVRYDLQSDGYTGRDLTIFASHLFKGHTIVSWAYQQEPESIVWAVRDDGMLLGLTYVREHEVWGWHRHDTADGDTFERVCCIPEGIEDALYAIVNRTVDGATVRSIERMHSRLVTDVTEDAFFVDAGITYDGRLPVSTYLALDEIAGVFYLLAGASTFSLADETNGVEYVLRVGDDEVRALVVNYQNVTQVEVTLSSDGIPDSMAAGVHVTDWGRAKKVIDGLTHLEGRTVVALADGQVSEQVVVSGGSVTLITPGEIVHVGLPIEADLETLNAEDPQRTLVGKTKRINEMTVVVESSRGFLAGQDENHLLAQVQASDDAGYDPLSVQTGVFPIGIESTWDDNGRVFIRQNNPLPLTVLAVAPSGVVGG